MDAKSPKPEKHVQSSTSQHGDRPTTSTEGQVDNQQQCSDQDTECKYTKEVNIFQVDSEQNNTTIYSCTHFNAFGFFKKISLSKSNNVSPEIENILDQS